MWPLLACPDVGGLKSALVTTAVVLCLVGCGPSSTGPRSAEGSIPDCAVSNQIQDLPVFAIGVSARGRVCWQAQLNQPTGNHLALQPILVDGGQVFLNSDRQLFALSVVNGRQNWTFAKGASDREAVANNQVFNQAVATAGGVVVASSQHAFVGLDEHSGSVRWRHPYPAGFCCGVPALATGDGGVVFANDAGEPVGVIDIVTGRARWQHPQPAPPQGSGLVSVNVYGPVIAGGTIVAPLTSSAVEGVSPRNGTALWHSPGPALRATAAGDIAVLTPPAGQGVLSKGVVATAVEAASGRPLWQYGPFTEPGRFSQVGGALIFSDDSKPGLARIDPATGRDLWRTTDTYPVTEVAAGGVLVSLESAGNHLPPFTVVGRDLATGRVLWRTPSQLANVDSTLVALQTPSGGIAVLSGAGTTAFTSAFDATSGQVVWQLSLPFVLDAITPVAGGFVLQLSEAALRVQGH